MRTTTQINGKIKKKRKRKDALAMLQHFYSLATLISTFDNWITNFISPQNIYYNIFPTILVSNY